MKSRFARGLAVYLVTACLLAGLAAAANTLTPETGLRRSIYTQADFAGTPIDERTAEVNLEFLNDRLDLPRRFFSVRWRGFVFLDKAQPVERRLFRRRVAQDGVVLLGLHVPLGALSPIFLGGLLPAGAALRQPGDFLLRLARLNERRL